MIVPRLLGTLMIGCAVALFCFAPSYARFLASMTSGLGTSRLLWMLPLKPGSADYDYRHFLVLSRLVAIVMLLFGLFCFGLVPARP